MFGTKQTHWNIFINLFVVKIFVKAISRHSNSTPNLKWNTWQTSFIFENKTQSLPILYRQIFDPTVLHPQNKRFVCCGISMASHFCQLNPSDGETFSMLIYKMNRSWFTWESVVNASRCSGRHTFVLSSSAKPIAISDGLTRLPFISNHPFPVNQMARTLSSVVPAAFSSQSFDWYFE